MLYARAASGLVAPVLVDVVVPAVLLESSGGRLSIGAVRYLGVPLIVLGAWLLLDSVFLRFAQEGRGTLNPMDPPRFVVRGGAYQVVRNPMYVANVLIICGTGLVFRSWYLFVWAAVMSLAWHVFVVLYEEPTLRRMFGEEYESYRRDVPRWIPRHLVPRRLT